MKRCNTLSERDMKSALARTAREIFGRGAPVTEEIRDAKLVPALPTAIFARGKALEAGMHEFLCRVLGSGSAGADAAASFMQGYGEKDKETIATSMSAVLMNTKSEDAFVLCLEAAREIKIISGREAALAFIKQCALRDFDENAIRESHSLCRDRYACELAGHIKDRVDGNWACLDVQSFFHSLLRIASLGGFADRTGRRELAREFSLTVSMLLANCPEAVGIFAEEFSAVLVQTKDLGMGLRLVKTFRNSLIVNELRQLRGDVQRIEERIAEFLESEK